jgi:hypothetical protein
MPLHYDASLHHKTQEEAAKKDFVVRFVCERMWIIGLWRWQIIKWTSQTSKEIK